MNHDAAVVITSGNVTVVNLNDARLTPAQLRMIRLQSHESVDLLTLQAAGASWYPICYEYPQQLVRELSRQKRLARLSYVERAIAALQPRAVAPFAGPPCFLDPDLTRFNAEMEDGIFPTQAHVEHWLRGRGFGNVITMLPGDHVDLPSLDHTQGDAWDGFSFDEVGAYLDSYQAQRAVAIALSKARYPEPENSLWEPFREYFQGLLTISRYFTERIAMVVAFDITGPGGGRWSVDFRPTSLGVRDDAGEASYWYSFESRWLAPILTGALGWEDFFLSLRFTAGRQPDVYNDHLLGLLKFVAPEALEPVERFERAIDTEETFTLYAEGERYRVQRRCPHGGQDLMESGEVLPGRTLRCLGHHYEFSLESGLCLNGSCPPLRTECISGR